MATLSSHTLFYSTSGLTRTTEYPSTRCRNVFNMPPPTNTGSGSIFGSLKKKLTRKGSNPLSSQSKMSNPTQTQRSNNPFASASGGAPPTRRPDRPGMNAFTTPSNEPPPAYTPRDSSKDAPELPATPVVTAAQDDDPYAFLRTFDTIFLIDDSGSMAGRSWRETGKALETITPICTARDADGIDIHFLNTPDSPLYQNVTSAGTIIEIFQTVRPHGGTPTGQRLNQILRPYLQEYEKHPETTKPINIIVITDGEAQDDVESPIITAAKKLDKLDAPAWQIGIQFFQVGNEPRAREHLKQLDDELNNLTGNDGMRDIVDTVPFTGEGNSELTAAGVLKCVLGSVNRRLDRRSMELHRSV